MKIKAIDEYARHALADWKKSYIADRLEITTSAVGQLVDGKAVEVKKAAVATCPKAITVLLREIKEAKPKGTET